MKVVVCIRQGLDGEISPFDSSSYEAALRIEGAEITLLSMGPLTAKDLLARLTRLGASRAVLLSDPSFAGADTLATAYTLSKAIEKLAPDMIFCGRQTLVGDTAQTGPMLAIMAGYDLITNVMSIDDIGNTSVKCMTRCEGTLQAELPVLLTLERIHMLRLPKLRSKTCEVEVWDSKQIGADLSRCGLTGSPTRVKKTFENESGKRKCKWIRFEDLDQTIKLALKKQQISVKRDSSGTERLDLVCIVGESPRAFADLVGDNVTVIPLTDAEQISTRINELRPGAVLWGSDTRSKRLAAMVAAKLGLGLCADCTDLEVECGHLMMYRPALSGSVIAKIQSLTFPAMATVRSEDAYAKDIFVTAGYGVKDRMGDVRSLADSLRAEMCVTRKLVDHGYAPYSMQVGLTGKTVAPPVYLAIGVSGAVHHIAGIQRAGTIIAINSDPNAPIFEYSDYGIIGEFPDKKL